MFNKRIAGWVPTLLFVALLGCSNTDNTSGVGANYISGLNFHQDSIFAIELDTSILDTVYAKRDVNHVDASDALFLGSWQGITAYPVVSFRLGMAIKDSISQSNSVQLIASSAELLSDSDSFKTFIKLADFPKDSSVNHAFDSRGKVVSDTAMALRDSSNIVWALDKEDLVEKMESILNNSPENDSAISFVMCFDSAGFIKRLTSAASNKSSLPRIAWYAGSDTGIIYAERNGFVVDGGSAGPVRMANHAIDKIVMRLDNAAIASRLSGDASIANATVQIFKTDSLRATERVKELAIKCRAGFGTASDSLFPQQANTGAIPIAQADTLSINITGIMQQYQNKIKEDPNSKDLKLVFSVWDEEKWGFIVMKLKPSLRVNVTYFKRVGQ